MQHENEDHIWMESMCQFIQLLRSNKSSVILIHSSRYEQNKRKNTFKHMSFANYCCKQTKKLHNMLNMVEILICVYH